MAGLNARFRRKKIISITLVVLSIFIVIIILSTRAVNKRKLQKAELEKNVALSVPVRIQKIVPGEVKTYIRSSATVQAWQEAMISSEISGRIKSLDAKVGDRLSKGSSILKVDDEILTYRLEDAKGRLLQLEANYLTSKSDLKRKQNLFKNKIIPEYDLETAIAKAKSDEGLLLSAKAQVDIAERDLRETHIISPIDGILAERFVDLGTNVTTGEKVASVVQVDKVKVSIGVTDIERSKINIGQKVELSTESYPGTVFIGRVYSIGLKANDASLTYPVEIVAENNNGKDLNPGVFVNVSILVSTQADLISVPQSIVESTDAGDFIWTVSDNRAFKKQVVVGAFSGTTITVKKGLNPGDQVVILGQESLTPDCDVNIIN